MAKFAHNLHKRATARYKEGTARGFLSPSVKPRTGYSGGTLAKMPSSIKVKFAEFTFRDCMKTPDRCRIGSPPGTENGPTGLYFGISCYRRPTIRASPTTFHTVSEREFSEVHMQHRA